MAIGMCWAKSDLSGTAGGERFSPDISGGYSILPPIKLVETSVIKSFKEHLPSVCLYKHQELTKAKLRK